MFLDDGIYADDWLDYYADFSSGGQAKFYEVISYVGRPFALLFYYSTAILHAPLIFYRIVAFLSLSISGLSVYAISKKIFNNLFFSAMLATLFVVFPGSKVNHWPSISIYTLDQALFMLGFFLLWHSPGRNLISRVLIFALTSLLLLLSYDMRSLLVVHYFFIGIFIMYRNNFDLNSLKAYKRIVLNYSYFLLLPVLYWVALQYFFPLSHGWEATYDASPSRVMAWRFLYSYLHFFVSLAKQFNQMASIWAITNTYIAVIVVSLVTYIATKKKSMPSGDTVGTFKTHAIICLFILVGSIFPYAVKGSLPTLNDFASRHLLITNLPLAYFIVSLVCFHFRDDSKHLTETGMQIFAVVIASCILCSGYNYIRVEANWINNVSLAYSIKSTPGAEDYSYYIVNINDKSTTYTNFPTHIYEWTGLFKLVWGNESRLGLLGGFNDNDGPRSKISEMKTLAQSMLAGNKYATEKYMMLTDLKPTGKLICLTAQAKEAYNDLNLVMTYYNYKLFDHDKLEPWLGHLWNVTVDYTAGI